MISGVQCKAVARFLGFVAGDTEAVRSLSLVSRVMGAHNIKVFKERKHGLVFGFSLPSGGSGSCECNIHVMTISSYNSANSYGQEWIFH
jgi:hypothetical protein